MKNQKGITLIALVITIIVLLILAGVSISMVVGDNGILKQANTAKTKTAEAEEAQQKALEDLKTEMDNWLLGGTTGGTTGGTGTGGSTAPTLASQITPANYGDTVEYYAPNGVNDWKVFYKEGNNVFLIASDYLENSKIPAATNIGTKADYPFSAYWPSENLTKAGASDISTDVANKYKFGWLSSNLTNQNNYVKATAALLDANAWSSFVNSQYADSAIGSPTLEMWVDSWNDSGYDTIYYNNSDSNGYYVGPVTSPTTTGAWTRVNEPDSYYIGYYLNSANGFTDELYFPHAATTYREMYQNCGGYWLASPNAWGLCYVDCRGGVSWMSLSGNPGGAYSAYNLGLRPVVCLNENVKATKTGTTWNLEK